MDDPESTAIAKAWAAISELPSDGKVRVIRYLAGRAAAGAAADAFDSGAVDGNHQPEAPVPVPRRERVSAEEGEVADRLRDAFADREIDTVANKILIAAAMVQKRKGGRPASAREIHEPLKEAGVSISNISAHLNAIIERSGRKQLTKVTEKNRQHRYQVTTTGLRAAENLLAGESEPLS